MVHDWHGHVMDYDSNPYNNFSYTIDSNDKLIVFAATNLPWNIDEAFLRRFNKRIYIPLPDQTARKQIFHLNLKDNIIEGITLDELAEISEVGKE